MASSTAVESTATTAVERASTAVESAATCSAEVPTATTVEPTTDRSARKPAASSTVEAARQIRVHQSHVRRSHRVRKIHHAPSNLL